MERNVESVRDNYAQVAAQWARQQRAYGQSVKIYHDVHRRWGRDERRTAPSDADPRPRREDRAEHGGQRRPVLRLVQRDASPADQEKNVLTRRQLEVAGLIARGMTNDQIARELVIATGTAANHVEHILRRLDIPNRAAVAAWFTGIHAGPDGPRLEVVPPSSIDRTTSRQ